jgi:hypothetical protein
MRRRPDRSAAEIEHPVMLAEAEEEQQHEVAAAENVEPLGLADVDPVIRKDGLAHSSARQGSSS